MTTLPRGGGAGGVMVDGPTVGGRSSVTPPPAPGPTFRALLPTVFVPAGIYGLGQGAAAPVVALLARDLGASLGTAGLVVALGGLGTLVGDLPAGRIVARYGERPAIALGSLVGAVGVALCVVADSVAVLGVGVALTGIANAVWGLARQSYLAEAVPFTRRARAMSTLAGMMRLGFFLGPFVGAGAIALGGTRGALVVQLAAVVVAGVLMLRMPDIVGSGSGAGRSAARAAGTTTLARIFREHRRLFTTLGAGVLLMGLARAARMAILPLWADHMGVDAATTSLVFGVGAAVDVLCSYPAGIFMDRYGRRFVTVPSMIVLGLGYLVLPLSGSVVMLTVVAVVLGAGNGLSNGAIMTIGADVAPAAVRAQFFGAWRLMHDGGMFVGPLAVAGIALVAPLSVAAVGLGVATLAGAAVMARFIPVYVVWPRPLTDPDAAPAGAPKA